VYRSWRQSIQLREFMTLSAVLHRYRSMPWRSPRETGGICSDSIGLSEDKWHTRFGCPIMSLDSSALPASLNFGDLKLPAGEQAGAIPPGSILVPAQEHFGALAIQVVFKGECVSARC